MAQTIKLLFSVWKGGI